MPRRLATALAAACVLVPVTLPAALPAPASGLVRATTRVGPPVAGTTCHAFPANGFWHADVSRLPRHPRSRQWLSHMSADRRLHPDFGPSYGAGPDYGVPVTVVAGSHPRVPVSFDYSDESDHVRYPLGPGTRVEGGRSSEGDRHAVVVDRTTCRLYETWATRESGGRWSAGSGATWSLRSNALRPDGWTSADAAGLPLLPGLLRWNEVHAGYVDHAIRFTTDVTSRRHVWPARHDAGSTDSPGYPPMGARFRLAPNFSAAGYGSQARVVIAAMKRYGLVLADNGSPWFLQGEQDRRWSQRLVADLKRIPAGAFVAVETRPLRVSDGSARVR